MRFYSTTHGARRRHHSRRKSIPNAITEAIAIREKSHFLPDGGKTLGEIGVKSDDSLEIVSLLTVVVKTTCGQSWSFEIFDNDTVGALKKEFAKVHT